MTLPLDKDWIRGNAKCISQYENNTEQGYCSAIWDRYLCWPPTPPGQIASIRCPQSKGIDISKFATRTCRPDGIWQWKETIHRDAVGGANESYTFGWSNYSQCFPPGVRELLDILNSQSESDAQRKLTTAEGTRVLEMIGLSISMVSLIMSLLIFCRFRNLRNNRTRIHGNLFIAMSIQVLVRLIVYSDQYLSRSSLFSSQNSNIPAPANFNSLMETSSEEMETTISEPRKGIEDTEYVCESFYILLEYARTSMFLWMFVEGLHLHNMITVSVFQEKVSVWCFYLIGWGIPAFLSTVWAMVTFTKFRGITCWWGYNLSPSFWILEGPRLTVIILNLIFLLNIMRVLVTKLRESSSSEAQQVRKAVRAAIVLLPLLGITNSLQMIHSPVDKDAIQFAIWAYLTAFLTSFQGFFCTLIYCFLNGEVQLAVRRGLRARFHHHSPQRPSSGINLKSRANATRCTKIVKLEPAKPKNLEKGNITIKKKEKTPPPMPNGDGFKEYWNEAELSSHNNVDIEHIEIPDEYYIKHGGRINASRCESVNKLVLNSASASSSTSSPTFGTTTATAPALKSSLPNDEKMGAISSNFNSTPKKQTTSAHNSPRENLKMVPLNSSQADSVDSTSSSHTSLKITE